MSNFEMILDKDESILKEYKPNKLKMYFTSYFSFGLLYLFVIFAGVMRYLFPEQGQEQNIWSIIISVIVVVVALIIQTIVLVLAYKKRCYCITNKRIIIRGGVMGVDYKSLDLQSISAVAVYVSFVDKLLHKDTGSLRFGSMGSPMTNNGTVYNFNHVDKPYEMYKEIKGYINQSK